MTDDRPYELRDLPIMAEGAEYDYRVIMSAIVPGVLARFLESAKDYGSAFKALGPKGQFSDIHRKYMKLYNAIWLDQPLTREPPTMVAEDIIGHCLLLMYLLIEQESEPENANDPLARDRTTIPGPEAVAFREGAPSLGEVLTTMERGLSGGSTDGTAATRAKEAVMALFAGYQGHPTRLEVQQIIKDAIFEHHRVYALQDDSPGHIILVEAYERIDTALFQLYQGR